MKAIDKNITNNNNIFSRVMIKLSGEALLGNKEFGIDSEIVDKITSGIVNLSKTNTVRKWYEEKLLDLGINSIKTGAGTTSNNHKLVIKTQDRDGLKNFLQQKGIQTQIHYQRPMSKMKMFDTGQEMPNAERFCQDVLSLPIHPFLKKSEVVLICNFIKEYYGI